MTVPSFLSKNGSRDFLDKQKNLFDVLNSAEKEKKSTGTHDEFMEIEQKSNKRKRKETKQFRGKESLFKEPIDLPVRFKRDYKVPDFHRNPHKWTKYSLANVTQDEMSNETNTATALSFLRDIKFQKKQCTIKKETQKCENKLISSRMHQFTAKLKQEKPVGRDSQKIVFKSTKLIMPEYIVGLTKKPSKISQKKVPFKKGKEIYLTHIHEYDDE